MQQRVTPSRWPLVFAWLATASTGVIALWCGAVKILSGQPSRFDPLIGLTALTVVALIWYTFYTRQSLVQAQESLEDLRQAREDAEIVRGTALAEHRSAVATAVLAELGRLVGRLANVATNGPESAASPSFIATPMLALASEKPELFSAATIQLLADAVRQFADVTTAIDHFNKLVAQGPLTPADKTEQAFSVKARAAWARNCAIMLTAALVGEGGLMPPQPSEKPVVVGQLPPMLHDPFERAD